jgi:NAD-dependent dihydropyrimidine dehydrogenase PreA subunit
METGVNQLNSTFERHHVEVKEAPWKFKLPPKFRVRVYNNCVNVQECVQVCVYNVHRVGEDGRVAEPVEEFCRGCHRCTLSCPKGAICVELNPSFERLGDSYFTPERIENIFFEAETGRVPVSGAGYGGAFAGRGFDSFWFDFSEIVRPTRDGIHGREYISTSVDLGRKPRNLFFDNSGSLVSEVPGNIEVPVPIILDAPLSSASKSNLNLALAKSASFFNTFAIVRADDYSDDLSDYGSNLIPRTDPDGVREVAGLIKTSRVVELDYADKAMSENRIRGDLRFVRKVNPAALVSARFIGEEGVMEKSETSVKVGVDIVHLHVEDEAVEHDPDVVKRIIQGTHTHLVERGIRDQVSIVFSGGIAEAAHVPKSIILGADAVAIGLAYEVALGCKVCHGNEHEAGCPLKVEEGDVELASQRIVNLVGSWRDQLLEVLGGMGLREVRRLRGELGRAIFYEELEMKIFDDEDDSE